MAVEEMLGHISYTVRRDIRYCTDNGKDGCRYDEYHRDGNRHIVLVCIKLCLLCRVIVLFNEYRKEELEHITTGHTTRNDKEHFYRLETVSPSGVLGYLYIFHY